MRQRVRRRGGVVIWLVLGLASPAWAQGGGGEAQTEAGLVLAVESAGADLGPHAERIGELASGVLRQGQSRSTIMRVPSGTCVAVVARAERSVANLDVALWRGHTALTRDTTTGPSADARYCAGSHDERLRLVVSAFRGTGHYAMGLYRLPREAPAPTPTSTAQGSALERLADRVHQEGGGMEPVTPPAREALHEGESVERGVQLAPGRCYRIVAAGESGIEDLDLALVAPGGGVVQQDGTADWDPSLGVLRPLCPAVAGGYRLVARAAQGQGAFAWQVLGSAPPGAAGAAASAHHYRVGGAGNDFLATRIRGRHQVAARGLEPVTDSVHRRAAPEPVGPARRRRGGRALLRGARRGGPLRPRHRHPCPRSLRRRARHRLDPRRIPVGARVPVGGGTLDGRGADVRRVRPLRDAGFRRPSLSPRVWHRQGARPASTGGRVG